MSTSSLPRRLACSTVNDMENGVVSVTCLDISWHPYFVVGVVDEATNYLGVVFESFAFLEALEFLGCFFVEVDSQCYLVCGVHRCT